MSGFLQRLALRESGMGASIAPRLPSWFEPAGGQPAAEPEGLRLPAAPSPMPILRPAAMSAPTAPVHDVLHVLEDAGELARTSALTPSASNAASKLATQLPHRQLPQMPALLARPQSLNNPPALAGRRSLPAHTYDVPDSPAPRSAAEHGRQSAFDVDVDGGARVQSAPNAPAPAAAHRPAFDQPAPSQQSVVQAKLSRMAPELVAAARASNAVRAAPAAPPAPDTVHVTIGRLEVRAVQAAKAPAPARSTQSPTSLDDYLARRNSEVRR